MTNATADAPRFDPNGDVHVPAFVLPALPLPASRDVCAAMIAFFREHLG